MIDAGIEPHQPRVIAHGNDECVIVRVPVTARFDRCRTRQSDIDQSIHACRLGSKVTLFERFAVARRTVRVVAVFGIEGIERRVNFRQRVARHDLDVVGHGRIEAAQGISAIAKMRVAEHDTVCRGQCIECVGAAGQFLALLAKIDAVLCHGLVETHRRSTAAAAHQDDFLDAGQCPQILDALFDIQGIVLPWCALCLVVLATRIHTENDEAARGHLFHRNMCQPIFGTMHVDDGDARRRECFRIRPVHGAHHRNR